MYGQVVALQVEAIPAYDWQGFFLVSEKMLAYLFKPFLAQGGAI